MYDFYYDQKLLLSDSYRGIALSKKGCVAVMKDEFSYTLYRTSLTENTVKIIILGGGGAGALFSGFVDEGLADAVCQGEIACAPNAYSLYTLGKQINRGAGVLFLANNFAGDFLNTDMAIDLLRMDGIQADACYISDDVNSSRGLPQEERGGLCGIAQLIKIASKAAKEGKTLLEVKELVSIGNQRLFSIAICLNPDTGLIEFGKGFSGEAPLFTCALQPIENILEKVLDIISPDLHKFPEKKLSLMLSRLFDLTYEEGYGIYFKLQSLLESKGFFVEHATIGSYFNVFACSGFILNFLVLNDPLSQYCESVTGYEFTI